MEQYKEQVAQDKPMCFEAQKAIIKIYLNIFDVMLPQNDFSENKENCIVESMKILRSTYCPDVKLEYVREEICKIYSNHKLLPKSDIMNSFLDCENLMK